MSPKGKHSVRVQILGEEYQIRSEVSPDHTRAVAAHYDTLVRQLLATGSVLETHRAAILAALQVTSELLEARAASSDLTQAMQALSDEVRPLLPPGKRGESTPGSTA